MFSQEDSDFYKIVSLIRINLEHEQNLKFIYIKLKE